MNASERAAIVAELLAGLKAPATAVAIPAPAVNAPPSGPVPSWVADAVKVKAESRKAKAATGQRPMVARAITVYPKCATCNKQIHDTTVGHAYLPGAFSNGSTEPFRTLDVSNGLTGTFHSGVRVNARALIAVAQWFNTDEGKAFLKAGVL